MLKRVFRFLIRVLLLFVILSNLWVLLHKWVPVYHTPLMTIRKMENAGDFTTKHEWVSLKEIAASLQLAVVCAEDQRFLEHNGFDYESIKKAYKENASGKRLRGASTISQQTAKNVFLWPERSWIRKGLETYFTFLIELYWSKERILEVYLNSIEMGPGIYGAETAANYWFEISARQLNSHQAASIAIILPNPLKYKATPRTPYLEQRKQWVLRQMKNFGTLSISEKK